MSLLLYSIYSICEGLLICHKNYVFHQLSANSRLLINLKIWGKEFHNEFSWRVFKEKNLRSLELIYFLITEKKMTSNDLAMNNEYMVVNIPQQYNDFFGDSCGS